MKKSKCYKGGFIGMVAWIGNKYKLFVPILGLLCILMFFEFISGILLDKKKIIDIPNKKYFIFNKKNINKLYKKTGYGFTIFVSLCIDYFVNKFLVEIGLDNNKNILLGLMTCIWFCINECFFILENVKNMGVELPQFITKLVTDMREDLDEKIIK